MTIKRSIVLLALSLLIGTAVARDQCDAVRATGLRLLSGATFDVNFPGTLNGCFTGYLPEGMSMEDGLYRFGVFRDGKLALPFSVIEAGMDLGSNPYQHLKILAVSFADLDNDGQRDVTVIGQNLVANGDRVFVQVYWGCGERFLLDDKIDLAIEENLIKASLVNVNKVQQFVRKRKLHPSCG